LDPFVAGNIPNFVRLANMYRGLQEKGIVDVAAADPEAKMQSIFITRDAWSMLVKQRRGKWHLLKRLLQRAERD
jgi:hypothetical protein